MGIFYIQRTAIILFCLSVVNLLIMIGIALEVPPIVYLLKLIAARL